MSTKKSIKEMKEDLRAIFGSSDSFELIRLYDYVSKTNFAKNISTSKASKRINENKYLDAKLRTAFEQLLEMAKPSQIIDL